MLPHLSLRLLAGGQGNDWEDKHIGGDPIGGSALCKGLFHLCYGMDQVGRLYSILLLHYWPVIIMRKSSAATAVAITATTS